MLFNLKFLNNSMLSIFSYAYLPSIYLWWDVCSGISFYLFVYLFIHKAEEQIRRGKESTCTRHGRASTPICWFIPQNALKGWDWVRLKPGARNSIKVSQVGGRDPTTWVNTCCLPGHTLVGRWNLDLNFGTLIKDVSVPSDVLTTQPTTMF